MNAENSQDPLSPNKPKRQSVRPISIEGIEYRSITEAAKALNLSAASVAKRVQSSSFPDWFVINPDDNLELVPEKQLRKTRVDQERAVVIEGIRYESLTIAAKELNLSPLIIKKRVTSSLFPAWFYINEAP